MDVTSAFFVFAAVIIIGFIANFIFKKTRIPDLIWLLVLGLVIGPGFHILERSAIFTLMPYLSSLALLFILFDAGLNMDIYKLIKEVPRGVLLSLVSFTLSMLVVGFLTHLILNLNFLVSLLLGSIIGGVSSPIVIPTVTRLKPLRERASLVMELESIITDPLAIITSLAIMGVIASGTIGIGGIGNALQVIVSSFSISIVFGLISGFLWLVLLQYLRNEEYFYILTLGFLFLIYALIELIGGNGAIAALITGIVLGNGRTLGYMLKIKTLKAGVPRKTRALQSEVSFFIKTFFFVSLGAIIVFERLNLLLYGLLLSLILLTVRWFAVWISTYKTGFNRLEKNIMTFLMPRGLSAAVLAAIIVAEYNLPGTKFFAEIVFSVIFSSALLATVGIASVARKRKRITK